MIEDKEDFVEDAIFEEVEVDEEEMCEEDADFYIEQMRQIDKFTIECIQAFFFDKNFHCGGKIPKDRLFHRPVIDFSEQAEISLAMDWFWKLTGSNGELEDVVDENEEESEEKEDENDEYFDWEYLNILLADIAGRGIPKNRAGGILILYLELVEAIPVNWNEIVKSL